MAGVSIDAMADAIMEGLLEYADLATEDMKVAVKKAAKTVKKDIQGGAPVKSGAYSKSWTVKTMNQSSNIAAVPLPNGMVKAKTGNTTDATVYAGWYKSVYMPTITESEAD